MPIIARFYGIIIKMFLLGSKHNPPHIHVVYGEHTALFDIQTMELLEEDPPVRAEAMVKEWLELHKQDLMEIWNTQEFRQLPPLK